MNEALFLLLFGNTARIILIGIFIILSILDVITTQKAIISGRAVEGNPIASWFISKFGLHALPFIKLPLILLVLFFGIYQENWALLIMDTIMIVVVVNNYRLYKKE